MGIFTNMQFRMKLKSILKNNSRKKEFFNIKDAQSIGMVFDAAKPETMEEVKHLINSLRNQKKQVHAIGIYDFKHPNTYQYIKTEIDIIGRAELKSGFIPVPPFVQTFINHPWDIFIEINPEMHKAVRYIAASSKAKCKVGIDIPENKEVFDILVTISPDSGVANFIRHTLAFLQMINAV